MTRTRKLRHLPLALGTALAVVAVGCGGEDEEPGALLAQSKSNTLLELVEEAEARFEDGECDELEDTLAELDDEVQGVSSDVDESFRVALEEETGNLAELADECKPAEEPEPEPVEPVEPVEPEPVEPVEPVEPEPVEPEEPEEPEEEPEEPGNGNGGNGNGGNGNGGNGGDNGSSGSGSGEVTPPGESGGEPPPSAGGSPPSAGTSGGTSSGQGRS